MWPGISGDCSSHGSEDGENKGGFGGAETELVRKAWLDRNIRSIGPLGKCYPRTVFLSEGDTPAYLGLIPNGLNTPEHPDWGGWAGRYQLVPSPEGTPVWSGSADTVIGTDGNIHRSPQASLWRWRRAFQLDFAARMAWTVCVHYEECAHPPVIRLSCPHICHVQPGQRVKLDASASVSPDGSPLRFSWYWYPEAGNGNILPQLSQTTGPCTEVLFASPGIFHLILEGTSEGNVPLTRYARAVFLCEESEENHGH